MTIRIALIGLGKIAHDQHLPAIAADPDFDLVATASADGATLGGVPGFDGIEALLASGIAVDAVAVCTPPQVRHRVAATALRHGLHVLLEKPPAASLTEAAALAALAEEAKITVFAAWHSRCAAGVAEARAWLEGRRILRGTITWREDVRVWHPGQLWIWQPGGLGVFDPGINALSIVTEILPGTLLLRDAELEVPSNRHAPIAARLTLETGCGAPIAADFDFRQTGPQSWDIEIETDAGTLRLARGGAELTLPDGTRPGEDREYPALYAQFARLIAAGASDLDTAPFRLVADAFLRGRHCVAEPFED